MLNQMTFKKSALAAAFAVALTFSSVLPFATASAKTTLSKSSDISFEKAEALAKKEVKGTIIKVEMDHEGRLLVYEVELLDSANREHDIDIDASSGKILRHRKSSRTQSKSKSDKLRGAKISSQKAITLAKKETGASTLLSYELDVEYKGVYWEIKLLDKNYVEYEVLIDAQTGRVVMVEADYDD